MIGNTTVCNFDNEFISLKIVNQAIGGDGTEIFNYNIKKYDTMSPSLKSFSLKVKADKEIKADELRGNEYRGEEGKYLEQGLTSYVITQSIPIDWALNDVVCQLEDGTETGATTIFRYGLLNVTIEQNKTTTCTFINTKRGNLEIIKKADEAKGDEEFNYDINFLSTGYLPYFTTQASLPFPPPLTSVKVKANEEETTKVYPGTYSVTEHLPQTSPSEDGWAIDKVDCELENGDKAGTRTGVGIRDLNIFAGKKTTCTFENSLGPRTTGEGGGERRGEPEEEIKTEK